MRLGYGQPVDDPSIPAKLEKCTRVFADSVLMMADCFDVQLDEVTFSCGWVRAPRTSISVVRYEGISFGSNYIIPQGLVNKIHVENAWSGR